MKKNSVSQKSFLLAALALNVISGEASAEGTSVASMVPGSFQPSVGNHVDISSAKASVSELSSVELPENPRIIAGEGSIARPHEGSLVFQQRSQKMVTEVDRIVVGRNAHVHFDQTTSTAKAALLRGSGKAIVEGKITADKDLVVTSSGGFLLKSGSEVRTGQNVTLSSLGISNENFMAGKLSFEGGGAVLLSTLKTVLRLLQEKVTMLPFLETELLL